MLTLKEIAKGDLPMITSLVLLRGCVENFRRPTQLEPIAQKKKKFAHGCSQLVCEKHSPANFMVMLRRRK